MFKNVKFFCFGSKIGELMSTTNTGFIVSFFPVKYNKNKIHYSKKSVFYTIKIAKNSLVFWDEKFDYKIVLGEKCKIMKIIKSFSSLKFLYFMVIYSWIYQLGMLMVIIFIFWLFGSRVL